jgi:cell division protein FtsA
MSNKNFQIYFDCGFSKIRAGAFDRDNSNKFFFTESKFFLDHTDMDSEIKKIITFLEKNTNEYVNDVNLMIDSSKVLSIGISVSKKIDRSKLIQEDVKFLIKEAKQQILKNYNDQNIVHIIINNYKVNDNDYDQLPDEIKCNFISLDILFICLPNEIIEYFKRFFHKLDISINQINCSSYAKTNNYKNNLSLKDNVSFIDVGFNKTSITSYVNNKIVSLDVLPIGGNNITKDISKVLKVNLKEAENIKLNFDKTEFLNEKNFSLDLVQKIIFARTEEILEICAKSIRLNLIATGKFKMILMGEGSKILDNQYKDKISFSNDIDFLEETTEDICHSGFKLGMGLNMQEVVVIPKRQIKQGFFEKFFHFFK